MNVIYASDNRFAPILAVSLFSLYQTNQNVEVMIIEQKISEKNKKVLDKIAVGFHQPEILFRKSMDINETAGIRVAQDRGSAAQFDRLFFERLIPDEWEKALYLDCDTLIRGSLDELWDQKLNTCVVGGILDAFSKKNYKMAGIEEKDILINSGVLLINIKKWKEMKAEKAVLEYVKKCNGLVPQGDQGIINYVLRKKIRQLPLKFNVVEYIYDFSYKEILMYRKPVKYYSEQQVQTAKKNPVIVHFTTSFASIRPWQGESGNPCAKRWKEYYLNLFQEDGIKKEKISFLKMVLMYVLRGKARYLAIQMIGIMHSYIRPLIFKLKSRFQRIQYR